ncbi:amino acid permease [Curtobacterium sp. MCSS17_008]|uniref:APC family permease n=1 Tax=Curtobacterium sp. MCSS17_008 TaxID=2175647 RepID=UPI000DA87D13|nr:APC family permease [Curtobacterium sp. MCSS17_008]PZF59948.1 amino acid permease [Curtobacterium sp. MCSS17_008]
MAGVTGPDRPHHGGALLRRLTLRDAVVIGLGSMIGAGVFSAFAPAAAAAGGWLLVGLALAGAVAFCNATSSAQLAAQYPTSGGTYVYGRERLGHWAGFAAGWCFVVGKTASAAAMALTFATAVAPEAWVKPVAVAVVIALTAVALAGITRTALVTRVLVVVALLALAVVVVIGATHTAGAPTPVTAEPVATPLGVLQSAGLLFFAFAGYARIATLGEEVVDPARTIPRAVTTALAGALVVYAVVALVLLHALGPAGTAATPAPLSAVADLAGGPWSVVVRTGAAAASLGALLAVVTGIGRTAFAMARERDLPHALAAVHPRTGVPHRVQLLLGAVVCVLVLVTDLRGAIGASAFGVLLYYAVANAAAWSQDREHRRYPRALAVAGVAGCVLLVVTLPPASVLAGVVVLGVGLVARLVTTAVRGRSGAAPRGRDRAGGDRAGGDRAGGDRPGGDRSGGDRSTRRGGGAHGPRGHGG